MSYQRRRHPMRLDAAEADMAIGNLTALPAAVIARSVVLAAEHDGTLHFATTLTSTEIAELLIDALSWLMEEIPEVLQ